MTAHKGTVLKSLMDLGIGSEIEAAGIILCPSLEANSYSLERNSNVAPIESTLAYVSHNVRLKTILSTTEIK